MLTEPRLRCRRHLRLSSEEVAEKLKSIETGLRSKLLKYDVTNLYLAGEDSFIAEKVSESFEDHAATIFVRNALHLVLAIQFVDQAFSPGFRKRTIFKIETGSGIGMRRTGVMVDLLLDLVVERPLLHSSAELGTGLYLQFRDDILVLLSDISFVPTFRLQIEKQASAYCIR